MVANFIDCYDATKKAFQADKRDRNNRLLAWRPYDCHRQNPEKSQVFLWAYPKALYPACLGAFGALVMAMTISRGTSIEQLAEGGAPRQLTPTACSLWEIDKEEFLVCRLPAEYITVAVRRLWTKESSTHFTVV